MNEVNIHIGDYDECYQLTQSKFLCLADDCIGNDNPVCCWLLNITVDEQLSLLFIAQMDVRLT
jgi:hypothetical protein